MSYGYHFRTSYSASDGHHFRKSNLWLNDYGCRDDTSNSTLGECHEEVSVQVKAVVARSLSVHSTQHRMAIIYRVQPKFCPGSPLPKSKRPIGESQGKSSIQVKVVVRLPFSNQLLSTERASFPQVRPRAQCLWSLRRHLQFDSGESLCIGQSCRRTLIYGAFYSASHGDHL